MTKQTDDQPAIRTKEEIADEKLADVAGGAVQMDAVKTTMTDTLAAKRVIYRY